MEKVDGGGDPNRPRRRCHHGVPWPYRDLCSPGCGIPASACRIRYLPNRKPAAYNSANAVFAS